MLCAGGAAPVFVDGYGRRVNVTLKTGMHVHCADPPPPRMEGYTGIALIAYSGNVHDNGIGSILEGGQEYF